MRPLLLSGYGTSLHVSGHVLEVSNGAGGSRATFSAHHLPFDSVVVEGNSGTISLEAARKLACPLLGQSKSLGLGFPFEALRGVVEMDTCEAILTVTKPMSLKSRWRGCGTGRVERLRGGPSPSRG